MNWVEINIQVNEDFRYMKIHIFALRWKDEIRRSSQPSWCFEGFDKSDRNHYEGKIALTCQNTLRTVKELFKFTIRIFVSQNCSNCTCFMLILYFFSEFFLFFSFRNPRGSLKEVVNREDMYH